MPASSSTSLVKSSKPVISLVGYQGSGKSTLSQILAKLYGWDFLEISSVVRAVHTGLSRDELPETAKKTKTDPNWLSDVIYSMIVKGKSPGVVLSGVREPQIHKYLTGKGLTLHDVEVKAHPALRYDRLLELQKVSNAEQFLNHEIDELAMGLRKVMRDAKYSIWTSDETDPRRLARAVKERLAKKGVK